MCVKLLQSCSTLCEPIDCSLSDSLSVGFRRQEYWSGLPFLSLGDLPDLGIEPTSPASPAFQVDSLPLSHLASLIALTATAAKSRQACPTLCDPIDGYPTGCSVPGILQARILEWVAISFSNAWKLKVKVKSFSCVWLFATPRTVAYQVPLSMGFSRQEHWSGLPLPSPIALTRRRQFITSTRFPTLWKSVNFSPDTLLLLLLLLSHFSHVRLNDHMDCSLPGSSDHGIFQARVLEWVAIAFSARHPSTYLMGIWTKRLWRLYMAHHSTMLLLLSSVQNSISVINHMYSNRYYTQEGIGLIRIDHFPHRACSEISLPK